MAATKHMVGLDCGNSSFRILLGRYDGEKITTEVVDQIQNQMVHVGDYYYWDLLKMFNEFKNSLKKIAKETHIDSIGICTWGVDFGLFDGDGIQLSNPLAYRNEMGAKHLERLSDAQKQQLFRETGILCDKINSVYLLSAIKENLPSIYGVADHILMVPDILNYFMTGVMMNEPSELSTTQLMSATTKEIDQTVCDFFGIDSKLFSQIGTHGQMIGHVLPSIKDEIEVDYDIPVICVPSHDTASAVAAIPTQEDDFIFISSGTWSLIGTELDQPVVTDEVYRMSLTNEVGAFNKITLLKNSAGMFIIQQIKKEYDYVTGKNNSWEELNALADSYTGTVPMFNINNSRFFNPVNMSKEIWKYLLETEQVSGEINYGAIIKAVQESMACAYAVTISDLETITQKHSDCIYIVGGGSKNVRINNLTASRTGKKVIACSGESTSLGNIATQLAFFDPSMDLKKIRSIIANSIETKVFEAPQSGLENVERYRTLE